MKISLKSIVLIVLNFISILFGWQYYTDLGGGLDDGRDIDLCADGGFFMTGRSNGWAHGGFYYNWYDHEAFLIKLNAMGEEEWIRHYGQNGWFIYGADTVGYYDAGWCVCATPDSGCIIAGKTQSPNYTDPWTGFPESCPGNDNVLLVRVDKNGDTLWTRSYGGYYYDRAWWIKHVPSTNEFFLAGPTQCFGADMPSEDWENIWIMKIDSVGNVLAETFWEDSTRDGHTDVRWGCLTPEGGCIVTGSTDLRDTSYVNDDEEPVSHRISRAVVVKVDSECNIEWSRIFDTGCSDHYSRSIAPTPGGGYIMLTYDKYPGWTWCIRLNEDGDSLWSKYIGLDPWDPETRLANFRMVVPDGVNGFYFAGSGQGWAWIIRTDAELNELWRVPADYGSESDQFLSCVTTPDHGCCAVGQTYSVAPSAYSDIFAMRVTWTGEDYTGIGEEFSQKPDNLKLDVYPNPFNSACKINAPVGSDIDVFDINGRKVYSQSTIESSSLDWTPDRARSSGTYLVHATFGDQSISKRVIYLK